jgi:hypothetical protein
MDEAGRFYKTEDRAVGTHIALRWNGRVRFTVPRDAAAQQACWRTFRPRRLKFPMLAMARLPRLFGAVNCVEAETLASIRQTLGRETGLSCCCAGAESVWSKDTILFLDSKTKPLYIVKAGAGKAVDSLLENEAAWLQVLRNHAALKDRIPEFVAHHSGADLCFVAQTVLPGNLDHRLGEPQFEFLRKLQECSVRSMRYEDSRLCRNLNSRLQDLQGQLSEPWSIRLDKAMRRINESFSRSPQLFVAAHNDFVPWNIRIQRNVASVFDWEYASDEQFPLFDPLHFALMPMALKRVLPRKIIQTMNRTLQLCRQWFGEQMCHQAEIQSLAYFVNLCTLYLWADKGKCTQHPTLVSYAPIIDYICLS